MSLRRQFAALHAGGERPHRVDDLGAAAVVDRQAERQAGVVPRQADVLVDLGEHVGGQARRAGR